VLVLFLFRLRFSNLYFVQLEEYHYTAEYERRSVSLFFLLFSYSRRFQSIFDQAFRDEGVNPSILKASKPWSQETYGFVTPIFVDQLSDILDINNMDVVVDVGSGKFFHIRLLSRASLPLGIGNVVLQLAIKTGARCHGIEIRKQLVLYANHLKKRVDRSFKLKRPMVVSFQQVHGRNCFR
jgi:hypothetical protein